MAQGDERRKHVRIFLPGNQVRIVTGPYMALVGHVIDISVSGARFVSESELSSGEFFQIEIVLPSGVRLQSECRIIHADRDLRNPSRLSYGVEFITLDDAARSALGEYIMCMRNEQDELVKKDSRA